MSSTELIGYTHDFLAEFIQLYRSFPCLWQVRCKGYKDRLLRNRAYDALVAKLREVNASADRETAIRKINTLRTAFRREYKKVRDSQRATGADGEPEHRYISSLWYYDLLKFVAEQNEEARAPGNDQRTAAKDEPENDHRIAEEDSFGRDQRRMLVEFNETRLAYPEQMTIQSDAGKTEPLSPASSRAASPAHAAYRPAAILDTDGCCYGSRLPRKRPRDGCQDDRRRRRRANDYEPIDESSPGRVSSCVADDEFLMFGRYVAGKLRKSSARQGIIAERLIADVLLRANLGTLEESTKLTEKKPSSHCFLVMDDR